MAKHTTSFWHVARVRATLLAVLAGLIVTMVFPHIGTTVHSQTADCIGWNGKTARGFHYTSDGVLHLIGCGEIFTLTDIHNALANRGVIGAPPADALQALDPAAKTWRLNVNLVVEEGATLALAGGSGDVSWLQLRSDPSRFVSLKAVNGNLLVENTKITSWNPGANAVDTTITDGRAYIVARTVWDGRPTAAPTSCSVNGGSQEAYEARMDIFNSEVAYLGYPASEAYGLTWKVYSKNPPAGRGLYDLVDVFGTVTGSSFHHNYFGAYTYGAYCMNWSGNVFENNHSYGLDPHDDSDSLTISNNTFRNNGNHGMICSVYCSDIVITNNESYGNAGNGIMIHRRVDGGRIEGNSSHDNFDSGIAVFDSHGVTIRGNSLVNNGNAAIRFSVGSSDNLVEGNTLTGSNVSGQSGYAVFGIMGSDLPTEGTNRRLQNNVFSENQISGFMSPMIKFGDASNTLFDGNTITASSSLTTFEFRDGIANVVTQANYSSNINVNTFRSSTSAPAASTSMRDGVVGKTMYIKHSPSGGSSTSLEDTRFHIWESVTTTVGTEGSTTTLSASNTAAKTLNFKVQPTNGAVSVTTTTWQTTSPYSKAWTETSSSTTGSVAHNLGNMQANTCFDIRVNSTSIGKYTANQSGQISFVYSGDYAGGQRSFTVAKASGCEPPPDTRITTGPTGTLNTRTVSFTYMSDPAGAGFECRIDSGAFVLCPATGMTYTDLANGPHTFHVRAVGNATDPSPATRAWSIDATAPTISANPAGGAYNAPQSIVLAADETADIYYTTDDSSPTTLSTRYTGPVPVSSTMTLRFIGVDAAGNTSAETSAAFVIDTTAPLVVAAPAGGTYGAAQNVTLTADEDAVIYFTLDGTDPSPTSAEYGAPIEIGETTTLRFLAVDPAGNQSILGTESYTIEAPPDTVIQSGPSAETNAIEATFTYSSLSPAATFECRLDDAPFVGCSPDGQTYGGLTEGAHAFEVRALGVTGADPTPAMFSWLVDLSPPTAAADMPGGTYGEPVTVALASDEPAAELFYSTDGSDPIAAGFPYSEPIDINAPTTLAFVAVDAAGNASAVYTEVYDFTVDFSDDFETGDLTNWNTSAGMLVQSDEVSGGTFAARATSSGGVAYARRHFEVDQTNLYYRTRVKIVSQGANTVYLLRFRTDTNGQILGLYVTSGGRLYLYSNNGATSSTVTSSQLVSKGEWHDIQVHVNIKGSDGQADVWLDGVRIDSLSGTRDLGTSPVGRIELGESTTGRNYDVAFDDVVASSVFVEASSGGGLSNLAAPEGEVSDALMGASTAEPIAENATPFAEKTSAADSNPTVEPTQEPSPTPFQDPVVTGQGTIAGTGGAGLNVRSAPDPNAPIIAVGAEGTFIELAGGATGDWQPVIWEGQIAYIAKQFVLTGPPVPTDRPTDPALEPIAQVPGGEPLNETPVVTPASVPATPTPYPILASDDSIQSGASQWAHDADLASFWLIEASPPLPELSLTLDLGQLMPIDAVQWVMATNGTASVIEFRLSEDGETWYSLATLNAYGLEPGLEYEQPAGVWARYVQVVLPNPDYLDQLGGFSEIRLLPAMEAQPLSTLGAPIAEAITPTLEPQPLVEERAPDQDVTEVSAAEPESPVPSEPVVDPAVDPGTGTEQPGDPSPESEPRTDSTPAAGG